jgi:E3 Ubiquitin ligase
MATLLGTALEVVAVVGLVVGLRAWPLWRVLRVVRPATPERLVAAAKEGRYDGRVVVVAGVAAPAPEGLLTSVVNEVPCVWHRHTVHRRRIHYRDNGAQRASISRRVADVASTDPIRLGPVEVVPAGMRVHRPVACATRILPALASEPFPDALVSRPPYRYRHREWVLRPGARLFVLGQVRSYGSRITLRRPDRGPHIISTRSIGWLRRQSAISAVGGLILTAVAGVAGAVILIVHFV